MASRAALVICPLGRAELLLAEMFLGSPSTFLRIGGTAKLFKTLKVLMSLDGFKWTVKHLMANSILLKMFFFLN